MNQTVSATSVRDSAGVVRHRPVGIAAILALLSLLAFGGVLIHLSTGPVIIAAILGGVGLRQRGVGPSRVTWPGSDTMTSHACLADSLQLSVQPMRQASARCLTERRGPCSSS